MRQFLIYLVKFIFILYAEEVVTQGGQGREGGKEGKEGEGRKEWEGGNEEEGKEGRKYTIE